MKKLKFVTLLTLVMIVLSACGANNTNNQGANLNSSRDNTGSNAGELVITDTITVSEVYHNLLYLPLYVANEKGFLAENGIKLKTIIAAGSGPAALASVMSGESAFSFHGPEHVAFARSNGGDAVSLSIVSGSAPVWAVAKEGSGLSKPEDFIGKTIVTGIAPTSSNSLLRKLFADNGIDIKKDVTITEVQNGSELGAILAGKADIAVVYEPQLDQGIVQGLEIVYDFTKDYPDFAFATINTSSKVLAEQSELVKRFVASIEKALDFIHENADETKDIAKQEFPTLEPSVVEGAVQRMIDSEVYPHDGDLTPSAFQNAIDMQKFIGNLKVDVSYEEMVDTSFVP